MPALAGRGPRVVELDEPRRAKRLDVDRHVTADRGRRPGGLQELAAGLDQVGGAGADLLRIADQQRRARRQVVGQRRQLGGAQQRQQRLHAVDRDALGQLGQHVGHAARHAVLLHRVLGGQLGGPVADVVGEQQLPARHGDHRIDGDLGDRALVGDGEHPHLGDLVAPELDAHRVLGRRREDVEDAAAHRELAALADHVDAGVGQVDEPRDDGVEFGLRTDGQRHRLDIGHVGCHRLQQRPRRGDHDPQRRAEALVVGMGQPAQQHQPRADGVDARRQPLVRQRLPGREHRDRLTEHAAQFGGQVVGFAPGGGDDEQRTGLRQRARREHPGAGRADEGEIAGSVGGAAGDIHQEGSRSARSTSPAIGVWTWAVPDAVMMCPS